MSPAATHPGAELRRQERLIQAITLTEFLVAAMLLWSAAATSSLSQLGEALRAAFFLVVEIYALVMFMAINRGRFTRFEYGTHKLELTVWLIFGIALLAGSAFMMDRTLGVVIGVRAAADQRNLIVAALVSGLALAAYTLSLFAVRAALQRNPSSLVLAAELKLRETYFYGGLGVQLSLTAAVLSQDAILAVVFDLIGAVYLAVLKLRRGLRALAYCLPELLDAPPRADVRAAIEEVARQTLPVEEFAGLRTRRSGRMVAAEVILVGRHASGEELQRWRDELGERFAERGLTVDLSFNLAPAADGAATAERFAAI